MIYSLSGKLIFAGDSSFAVECGGVGYLCKASGNTLGQLPPEGSDVFVFTMMTYNGETGPDLYGFFDASEKSCFEMLTSVNGVGPKAALSILSEMTPDALALAIASGDSRAITAAKGVGPKAAQRIILELSDKVTAESAARGFSSGPRAPVSVKGNAAEAISALVSLGYSNSEAAAAVGRSDPSAPVDEIIKAALKALATRR